MNATAVEWHVSHLAPSVGLCTSLWHALQVVWALMNVPPPLGAGEGVLEPVHEQRPVGQAGERVAEGLAGELPGCPWARVLPRR